MPYVVRNNRRYTITDAEFQNLQMEALDNGRTLRARDRDIAGRVERGEIPQPAAWGDRTPVPMPDGIQERIRTLQLEREQQRAMLRAQTEIRAATPFFNQEYVNPYKAEVQMAAEQFPPLTFPLVAETDVDGVKKLYKTRYNELEKRYSTLYNQASKKSNGYEWAMTELEKAQRAVRESVHALNQLQSTAVDSEVVVKRMEQVCKELGMDTITKNPRLTMGEKLDQFFGALMTRIRCEEVPDELAD